MNKAIFEKDIANKRMFITRSFAGSLSQVWQAWTDSTLLDQWWAPKPWKAETKSMDFSVGGFWLYAMVGPEGEKHWARADYKVIEPQKYYEAEDAFCDEDGNIGQMFLGMYWKNSFSAIDGGTQVSVEITFRSEGDLEKIVEMGFEEGFTAAQGNLDELLAGK